LLFTSLIEIISDFTASVFLTFSLSCKKGAWKKEHTIECLKCFNLERNIDAGIDGVESPDDFSLEQYTNVEVVSTDDEYNNA
jgi:hypothetical protein